MKIFRQLFIIIFFSLILILTTLSIARDYYLGGSILKGKETLFVFLSEILPNTNYFIQNKGIVVEGLLTQRKQDLHPEKFNVPGLYSYFTENGWVILDQMEHSSIKIPIEWAKFRETFTKFNQAKEYINTKYAAAPWNPIKVNQNIYFFLGSVLFKYNIPTKTQQAYKGNYHHSLEIYQDSLIYTCIIGKDTFPHFNDAILLLNLKTGKPVFEKSITEILIENNYEGLLYGAALITQDKIIQNNTNTKDIIHLNDVQPIRKGTNFAKEGDLLISMRHLSTVMLYRPSINKILWLSQGPWLNQHDADVLNEDEIGVYNNNYIRNTGFYKNESSHVVRYNFKTKKYGTLHKQAFEKYQIKSDVSSRFEILDNGNMFVEDSPSGAYYLLSPKGILIARKSFNFKDNLASLGVWARPYTSKLY
jgi:hypothetical protein